MSAIGVQEADWEDALPPLRGSARLLDGLRRFTRRGSRAKAVASCLAAGLGIVRPRRAVALDNLRSIYPDSSEEWRREVLRGCYRHLSWMVAEYLALLSDPKQALSWVYEVEGKDVLDDLHARGGGALLISGHLGNWELMAAWFAQSGYPMRPIARPPDDWNLALLIEGYRRRAGVETFQKDAVAKQVVRFVKDGGFLGLMPDQAWDSSGVSGPFMGRMCSTAAGPAAFARLSGAPVVPVFSCRVAPFRHRIVVAPPIPMESEGAKDDALRENTLRINRAIETMVRAAPEQWLWLHRRWRIQAT